MKQKFYNGEMCPCGRPAGYEVCCSPLHQSRAFPSTACRLMESRYCAYVVGAIDYLVSTTFPAARHTGLWIDYESTHKSIEWLGLEVIRSVQGGESDKTGKVEFKASYLQGGSSAVHHELSRFRRHSGRWCYVDGIIY